MEFLQSLESWQIGTMGAALAALVYRNRGIIKEKIGGLKPTDHGPHTDEIECCIDDLTKEIRLNVINSITEQLKTLNSPAAKVSDRER